MKPRPLTLRQLEGISHRAWLNYEQAHAAYQLLALQASKADKRRWKTYAKAVTAGRAVAAAKDREATSKQR